jgi:hypothetical protein
VSRKPGEHRRPGIRASERFEHAASGTAFIVANAAETLARMTAGGRRADLSALPLIRDSNERRFIDKTSEVDYYRPRSLEHLTKKGA